MNHYKKFNNTLLIILITIIPFFTNAQKLPKVQETSQRVPANVKIDGKLAEWNKFGAYNSKAGVFYTIANDDDKLYLTLQAKDMDVITKMIRGGVTLTINSLDKKDDKNGISIQFPAITRKVGFSVNLSNKPKLTHDTMLNRKQLDSFAYVVNKELTNKSKFIVIGGIKAITDDSISVYNEYGIKAVSRVDNQINYVYELAIPLKYLGLSTDNPKHFFYNIKVNAIAGGLDGIDGIGKITSVTIVGESIVMTGPGADRAMSLMNYTDFWGEYTLAKK